MGAAYRVLPDLRRDLTELFLICQYYQYPESECLHYYHGIWHLVYHDGGGSGYFGRLRYLVKRRSGGDPDDKIRHTCYTGCYPVRYIRRFNLPGKYADSV